jgi:fibro-slime domain-containing protein
MLPIPKRLLIPARIQSKQQGGFVLALTIILILGVTAISVSTLFNSKTGRMSAANYESKLKNFAAADGMVTLLSQDLINGNGAKYIDWTRYGKINGKVWTGLPGTTIKDLKNRMVTQPTPNLPTPGWTITSNYLGKQVSFDDYGTIWYGYIIPPYTGNYTFITRSDDASNFYLSQDTSKINVFTATPICSLATWVYNWPTSGSAVSAPQSLIAGKRYYFEYLVKEGTGFDVGQMGWDGPNGLSERPITGSYISEYSTDADWNGTLNVGGIPVRYRILGNGRDNFSINVEAITTKIGNSKDTVVRTPLTQSLSMVAQATSPPLTLDMPVIYYDYLSDKTNPEFNQNGWGTPNMTLGTFQNMVNKKLTDFTSYDASYFNRVTIGKPTKSSNFVPNRSCGLNMWFKDWVNMPKVFRYNAGDDCSQTISDPTGDAWRNVKRKSTLTFTLDPSQGKNVYTYSRMGDVATSNPATNKCGQAEFFPLDAFGKDPATSSHNYGFCMEMHTTFTHQSGLIFEFTGDDDTWVYINDSLVIDLGGVHASENKSLVLDELPLSFGKTYNFDFFQCERMETNSICRIVTNIKMQNALGKPQSNWRRDYGNMN